MSLVKVSVEDFDSSERLLHEIDKSKSLEENIKSVCRIFHKPTESKVYGLKFLSTNDGTLLHSYISAANFNDIKDGYFLKLVYSVGHYVERIFEHINDCYKSRSFLDLHDLSHDEEFIKELVRNGKHVVLINHFTEVDLEGMELTACLIAIVHLFQKGYITDLTLRFMEKVLSILKTDSSTKQITYSLLLIHKILAHRDPNFNEWKEKIIKQIPIMMLISYIRSENSNELKLGALLVINAIIRCCKDEKRLQLIKEINLRQNRGTIYEHLIFPGEVMKEVAHELYVYQTYLFR